jgi:hypothetical protein
VLLPYEDIGRWLRASDEIKNKIKDLLDKDRQCDHTVVLEDDECMLTGRGLLCLCDRGQYVSVTVRRKGELTTISGGTLNNQQSGERKLTPGAGRPSDYAAGNFDAEAEAKYLNPLSDVIELVYDKIMTPHKQPLGLLIIAGATGTGKSSVAEGLIDLYLNKLVTAPDQSEAVRLPHLVTYEDPIEKFAFQEKSSDGEGMQVSQHKAYRFGVDYTPRQKGEDVISLQQAFQAAKRQTPSLFYAGEIRNPADWPMIVRFAGEGNLVVATTHSNSLVECLKQLLTEAGAKTAVERGHLASRLLGVIHLQQTRVDTNWMAEDREQQSFTRQVTLPSVWRRTPRAVSALVSDGLSSLLPYNPTQNDDECSSIGRYWFASELLKRSLGHHKDKLAEGNANSQPEHTYTNVSKQLTHFALNHDLLEV